MKELIQKDLWKAPVDQVMLAQSEEAVDKENIELMTYEGAVHLIKHHTGVLLHPLGIDGSWAELAKSLDRRNGKRGESRGEITAMNEVFLYCTMLVANGINGEN